jgi:hypothetical protein
VRVIRIIRHEARFVGGCSSVWFGNVINFKIGGAVDQQGCD